MILAGCIEITRLKKSFVFILLVGLDMVGRAPTYSTNGFLLNKKRRANYTLRLTNSISFSCHVAETLVPGVGESGGCNLARAGADEVACRP